MRGLVVVPDIVEDRRVDVSLIMAEVRLPLAGEWIEMGALGLLGTLAAALPREHRTAISCLAGRRARLAQPAVSIHQKTAGNFWQPNVEERKCVDFVPEDVTSVGLPVQSAGRQPGVEIRGMNGAHLQHVGDVQPEQQLHALVSGHLHVANLPELIPCRTMSLVGVRKIGVAGR